MLLFIDTEFTDITVEHPELISLALVSLDGAHEFYVEIDSYDRSLSTGFVQTVVEPQLKLEVFGCGRFEAARRLRYWLELLPENRYTVAIDYNLDWELLVDLFDGDLPKKLRSEPSNIFSDLSAQAFVTAASLGIPTDSLYQGVNKAFEGFRADYLFNNMLLAHHALHDAKANRAGYLSAVQFLRAKIPPAK